MDPQISPFPQTFKKFCGKKLWNPCYGRTKMDYTVFKNRGRSKASNRVRTFGKKTVPQTPSHEFFVYSDLSTGNCLYYVVLYDTEPMKNLALLARHHRVGMGRLIWPVQARTRSVQYLSEARYQHCNTDYGGPGLGRC